VTIYLVGGNCMRILVTGAAGFVGQHLINELKKVNGQDSEIYAFVLNEQEKLHVELPQDRVIQVDITNEKLVMDAVSAVEPDVVYHLAAQSSVGLSWKRPSLTYQVNLVGTTFLLESLMKFSPNATVLLIGSAEQYKITNEDEMPISEEHKVHGGNPYAVSKMAQESAAELFLSTSGLKIIRVRAFNHIGAGQESKFVIPDWCSQVIEMENNLDIEPVLMVGNIKVKRDFTDVRDIVRAYIMLAEFGKSGEIYNVGSGVSHSLEEVLSLIIANSKREGISWQVDSNKLRPTDIMELRADITKLKNETGWEPQIGIEQSVYWIMEEMRRNGEAK